MDTRSRDTHPFRALVVRHPGGPEALSVTSGEYPQPGPGEVLVRVGASGVNFIDVYQREGRYPTPTPFVLGVEGAGEVLALGPGVTSANPGDRVAWVMVPGSAATHAVVPASSLIPLPPRMDLDLAAASLLQGMTAHFLTTDTYAARPGTIALVHAAAGGVGQWLVQLLKAKGATVIATAGSAAKCATATTLGADVAIDYSTTDDLAAAITDASPAGVDVVYDGVGADTLEVSLTVLRPRGLLAIFGAASGPVPPFDIQRLNAGGSLFLTRPSLGHYLRTRDELLTRSGDVLAAVSNGSVQVSIGGRYRLEDAPEAYRALEGRASQGKLLLFP